MKTWQTSVTDKKGVLHSVIEMNDQIGVLLESPADGFIEVESKMKSLGVP